ncbi:centrosomal protein of 19 kDa-like [Oratosquilla oratoria]|uniref:centrosomal protein of 19 kDa-like n=1 Tax=Oratosquilla oratoria TaxID=337810 RepID=UPI003F767608
MGEEYICHKLGIRSVPPAITLLYSTEGKKRYRIMPVRNLNKFGPVQNIVKDVKTNHLTYLGKVPDFRIEKMVRILQELQKGHDINEAISTVGEEFSIDPNQDLNKLTDEALNVKKKVMESSFTKNQLKPGDENYEYDKQVEYDTSEKVEAGWDSSNEGDW